MTGLKKDNPRTFGKRTLARLAAVQALYQVTFEEIPTQRVIQQFSERKEDPLSHKEGVPSFDTMDQSLFQELVLGVSDHREDLQGFLLPHLPKDWKWERIDPVVQMILYLGAYELAFCPQVPPAVVISEYLNIAHAFYEGEESAFVNGILDRVAKVVRAK